MNTSNRFDVETLARQRGAEISKELTTRPWLKEAKLAPLTLKQARNLVVRLAPVVIAIMALFLLAFAGW